MATEAMDSYAPLEDAKASPAGAHSHGDDDSTHHGHSHSHGHSHGDTGHGHSHGKDRDDSMLEEEYASRAAASRKAKADKNAAAIWQLSWAIALCFFFMIAEAVGGYFSGSIAILTDAAHMLSDVASLVIGVMAMCIARWKPTESNTFGWRRFEVFGALISVLIVWLLVIALVYEAVLRVNQPEEVDGRLMFIVATIGFVVNIALMRVLHQAPGHGHSHGGDEHPHDDEHHGHGHGCGDDDHHGHGHGHDDHGAHAHGGSKKPAKANRDCCTGLMAWFVTLAFGEHGHSHGGGGGGLDDSNINVRAAFIHALGDLIQSIGVMIAAALIWYNPEWRIADPICTFVFSALVMWTTFGIVKDASSVLMMSVPSGIDPVRICEDLEALPGVSNVHDLHVWALTPAERILTVHIIADAPAEALTAAQKIISGHGIGQSTIQVERCGTGDLASCWAANDTFHFELTGKGSNKRRGTSSTTVPRGHATGAKMQSSLSTGLLGAHDEESFGTGRGVRRTAYGLRPEHINHHIGCSLGACGDEKRMPIGDQAVGRAASLPAAVRHGHSHAEPGHGHSHAEPGHAHSHAEPGHGHSHGH